MRLKLILLIAAGALGYYGWEEFTLSQHAKPQAEEVSAADLEAGKIPDNCHVKIKDALALYPASVYHYSKSKYSTEAAGPATKTSKVLYPVVSMDHPFAKTLLSGKADEKSLQAALSSVSIIVKAKRFDTIGSIPTKIDKVSDLQGLVLNHVEKLESKDEELLRSSFPKMDASKVIIIEEGRTPKPVYMGIAMMAGAGLLGLGTVGSFFRK